MVIVDPDVELRQILLYEVRQAVNTAVSDASPSEANIQDAIVLAMPSKLELLPQEADCIPLRIQPVQDFAARYSLAPPEWLIAVVSRWRGFLQMARTMLAACGCDLDSVMFRDARESEWQNGLNLANVIICDSLASNLVPRVPHVITYRLLSDEFLSELRERCS